MADRFFIQFPFFVSIVVLFSLIVFLFSKNTIKNIRNLPRFLKLSWLSEIKLFLSNRQLKGMGIMGMVMHATNPAFNVFLPLLIINKLGFSYTAIGTAMIFYYFSHIFQHSFGALTDKIGHWKGVLIGTAICGIFLVPIFILKNYFLLIIFLFLAGIGTSIWNVSAWSLMSEIGEKMKAECQVLTSYFSIAKIGELLSFIICAFFVKIFPIQNIFLLLGIFVILGNVFSFKYLKPAYLK